MKSHLAVLALFLWACVDAAASQAVPAASPAVVDYTPIDALFETYMRENHAPGVIYGIVHEGKLAPTVRPSLQTLDWERVK